MLQYIETILADFRTCFTRIRAYLWFLTVIIGLMIRSDHLGITSIVRALHLKSSAYDSLIHFFRSDAYSTCDIREKWFQTVRSHRDLAMLDGRILLLGDGAKRPKEGRHMPGVKKLHQESENSAKGEYIFGHMYGGIAAILNGKDGKGYGVPLDMTIQDGLRETAAWENGDISDGMTHVLQMIHNGYEAARSMGPSLLVLDRYFLTVPAIKEVDTLDQNDPCLNIVTRAKSSTVAYTKPEETTEKRRGRPRKKGMPVKLQELFSTRATDFVPAEAMMYGKMEKVQYLCLNLLWGEGLYREMRFVLVKSGKGDAILACTDITLDPLSIIEAYAHRFKIEETFKNLNQQTGAFSYHFWTSAMPRIDRWRKKDSPTELSRVESSRDRRLVLATVKATERFVLFSCIALGLLQMMARIPVIAGNAKNARYLRTPSKKNVSEGTIAYYLRLNFFRFICSALDSPISRFILSRQCRDYCVSLTDDAA